MLHTEQLLMVGGSHIMRKYEHLLLKELVEIPMQYDYFPHHHVLVLQVGHLNCYHDHILAAKSSIGMEYINPCHKVNLIMLRKNVRSKKKHWFLS